MLRVVNGVWRKELRGLAGRRPYPMEQTSLSKLVPWRRWKNGDSLKGDIYPIIEISMRDENAVVKTFKKHQKRAFVGRLNFFKEIFIRFRKQQIPSLRCIQLNVPIRYDVGKCRQRHPKDES